MNRVAVSTKVLRWALHRSARSLAELASRFPRIGEWAAGEAHPTLRQLESLAKATSTPLGFFFLAEPPDERLPVPYFRTLRTDSPEQASPDLLDTVQMMQRRQAWMREFLLEEGRDALPFVGSARTGEQRAAVAERMRGALGLQVDWASAHRTWSDALHALREAVDEAGILVVVNGVVGNNTHRKLNPHEFRGFVLVDEFAPLVFVNGADGRAAQMFTLAHELAHVFFGSSAAFDLRQLMPAEDATEQACNQVAAEFLVPERVMRQVWPSISDAPAPFQEVARRFKVSELVVARRALDLDLIGRDAFFAFYDSYQTGERRAASQQPQGGDFYANQNLRIGHRFGRTVVRAAREDRLLYSEAYHLTGLYGKTFDAYAASLAVGGPRR
jgi:Zn-dependent peptidase ImmA (M78 family)